MRVAVTLLALVIAGCARESDSGFITPEVTCTTATVGLGLLLADGDLSSDQRARGDFVYYPAGVSNCADDDPAWSAVRDSWDAMP